MPEIKILNHLQRLFLQRKGGMYLQDSSYVFKELLSKSTIPVGLEAHYVTPETAEQFQKTPLTPHQIWVFDGFNDPHKYYIKELFLAAIKNAHENGGFVFVTSTKPLDILIANALVSFREQLPEYQAYARGLFDSIPNPAIQTEASVVSSSVHAAPLETAAQIDLQLLLLLMHARMQEQEPSLIRSFNNAFSIQAIPPDGNCLYSSLITCLLNVFPEAINDLAGVSEPLTPNTLINNLRTQVNQEFQRQPGEYRTYILDEINDRHGLILPTDSESDELKSSLIANYMDEQLNGEFNFEVKRKLPHWGSGPELFAIRTMWQVKYPMLQIIVIVRTSEAQFMSDDRLDPNKIPLFIFLDRGQKHYSALQVKSPIGLHQFLNDISQNNSMEPERMRGQNLFFSPLRPVYNPTPQSQTSPSPQHRPASPH